MMEIWHVFVSCINVRKVSSLRPCLTFKSPSCSSRFILFPLHFIVFYFYQYSNFSTSANHQNFFMIFQFFCQISSVSTQVLLCARWKWSETELIWKFGNRSFLVSHLFIRYTVNACMKAHKSNKNLYESSSQSGVYTVGVRFDSPVSEQQRVALRLKTPTASVDLFIT